MLTLGLITVGLVYALVLAACRPDVLERAPRCWKAARASPRIAALMIGTD